MQDQNSLREQARKAAFYSPRAAFLRINAGQILTRGTCRWNPVCRVRVF
jgi:hypothetical protein